ncbi:MAG: addiction module protein [Cephaloticoccus sp.]|nr:addiction module protein [Cephaloticoccus sp.]MCF7760798.1 addiction module protein [Cephaloticoccus sp.]
MSTPEILAQLPRLTPAEREVVRLRLDDLDSAAPLSPEEKRLIDERVAAYRQNPEAGIPWAVAEADIRKQLGM